VPLRDLGWWGLLPPIRRGSQRWWLPLSDTATVALGHAIQATADGHSSAQHQSATDSLSRSRLMSAFRRDPPLLLYARLNWTGDGFVSLSDLANWLVENAGTLLSSGEWMLARPELTVQTQRHWSRLMAQCSATDPEAWETYSRQWLEVLGPPVDAEWESHWPAVIWDDDPDATPTLDAASMLHRAAIANERQRVTDAHLDALAEKRKLAAAKQLAYGLSHEINNPLANISARAEQLIREESDERRIRSLRQIVSQAYRAHEMIAGLMFFANPIEPQLEQVDLNEVVAEVVDDFAPQSTEQSIRLYAEPHAEPATVRVDRSMVLEAARVLVRNAIEAIGTGGTVVVSLAPGGEAAANDCWRMHVADSGPGLSAAAARHAFDPFFSGREAGRGLGLGLCRAYRIARLHQATIRLSVGLAGCVATIEIPTGSSD
jgi:signal transduction histidine kinase